MNAGIVVEGPDDAAVYPLLIRRIDPRIERVHSRECGGRHRLRNKFVTFLDEFIKNPAAFGIGTVIVVRDSDCSDPGPIEQELRTKFANSGLRSPFSVSFHATKCMLESWLLADEEAINSVSALRGGPAGIARFEGNLENLRDADRTYRRLLSQARLQDTSQVMREIAQRARLEIIEERCPRFGNFVRKVRGDHG